MYQRCLIYIQQKLSTGLGTAFGKYLLLSNTLSSGVLMLIGHIIQQGIESEEGKPPKYDYTRMRHMFIAGMTGGAINHYYYGYINYVYPKRNFASVAKKVVLDQVLMSPISIMHFFYFVGYLEGKTLQESTHELREKVLEVYIMDCCMWPPAMIINFAFIPMKYQVVFLNVISVIYNVYLSYVKYRGYNNQ